VVETTGIDLGMGITFAARAYNGRIPGPTIEACEGDTVTIHVHNKGHLPRSRYPHIQDRRAQAWPDTARHDAYHYQDGGDARRVHVSRQFSMFNGRLDNEPVSVHVGDLVRMYFVNVGKVEVAVSTTDQQKPHYGMPQVTGNTGCAATTATRWLASWPLPRR
jgi:hypothetical protein